MINSDIVEEFKNAFKAWEAKRVQVKHVVQLLRRPPFSLRDGFKKLDLLESMNIIEKVNSVSSWVSPVAVVPKPNGEVR